MFFFPAGLSSLRAVSQYLAQWVPKYDLGTSGDPISRPFQGALKAKKNVHNNTKL